MEEIWKDIEWYEWIYQVSDIWRVKSLHKKWWLILKEGIQRWWYVHVNLWRDWLWKSIKVHKIVMLWFMKYVSWMSINHKNWIKTDNRLDNLEMCTYSENMLHAYSIWLYDKKLLMPHPLSWKTWILCKTSKRVLQYSLSWEFIKEWGSTMDIERELWFKNQYISRACRWIRYSSFWYKWIYKAS